VSYCQSRGVQFLRLDYIAGYFFLYLFILDADDGVVKRRDAARKKDTRKDRKDKGYVMFEEEDSEEELVADDAVKCVSIDSVIFFSCFAVIFLLLL